MTGFAGLKVDLDALEGLSPEEQEKARRELESIESALKENPLWRYNHPVFSSKPVHSKQLEFHAPPFPKIRCFFGGNRSGKTTASMVDTIIQCIDDDAVPDHLKAFKRWQGDIRVRVLTPDFGDALEVALNKIREWCPRSQFKGNSFDRAFDKQRRILTFKNGSRIHFNSNEQDRDKLQGLDLHRVVYDEEPRLDLRQECWARLTDHNGDEVYSLTPFSGMEWLYDKFYEPWERGVLDEKRVRVVVVDMDDNPNLDPEGKREMLSEYSGAELKARKSGQFVSFSGMIYPGWEETVVPEIDRIPPGAEVFRGVDPGWRHMMAVVYCYLDLEDTLVVFDEIGLRESTIKDVCDEMALRDLRWGVKKNDGTSVPLRVNWTVIDPASRNKNTQTGRSDQQEFHDHGVFTMPGQNAKNAGINRVLERMNAGKLQVTANCTELQGQFKRYRWVKDTNRSEHEAKAEPVKKDDHLLDALRYVVMQRPLAPQKRREPGHETAADRWKRKALEQVDRFAGRQFADSGFGPGQFS